MTQTSSFYLLLAFFLSFMGLAACDKDKTSSITIINGTITDAKTGIPIEGVSISYGVFAGPEPTGSGQHFTDIDGKFTIKIGYRENFSGLTIQRDGYVPKFGFGTAYEKGVVNDLKIKMHPRDALLRLVYENTSNQEKPVYTQAKSRTFSEEYGILPYIITQPYPYISQPNSKDTLDYPFTSDEQINLFWDFIYYTNVGQATFRDSLFLSRGDTATYSISF